MEPTHEAVLFKEDLLCFPLLLPGKDAFPSLGGSLACGDISYMTEPWDKYFTWMNSLLAEYNSMG